VHCKNELRMGVCLGSVVSVRDNAADAAEWVGDGVKDLLSRL